MAPFAAKGRRMEDEARRPKKKIKVKRQREYHSSSEDEDEDDLTTTSKPLPEPLVGGKRPKSILKQAMPLVSQDGAGPDPDLQEDNDELDELEKNTALNSVQGRAGNEGEGDAGDDGLDGASDSGDDEDVDSEEDDDVESEATSISSTTSATAKKKRNDPTAFANSISAILSTKLSTSKRSEPVLSRSKTASDANKALSDAKLEAKAKQQLRAEKQKALERGRVRDVLGLETADVDTGVIMEEEKKLKKTAQRGVVRLFNAVRAAQVSAEEGAKKSKEEGVVGMDQREEKVREMSKKGFLELISSGGKTVA